MKVGDTYQGTVTAIKPYGAFVELPDQTVGLVHISEIRSGYITDIYKVLSIGQTIKVQVIDIDEYNHKPSFSMRTLAREQALAHHRHRFSKTNYHIGFKPLKDNLPVWIEEGLAYLEEQDNS